MSYKRYILIDSTYRNRSQYPLQSDFTILSEQQNSIDANDKFVQDPVTNALPIYPIFPATSLFTGGSAAAPILDASASTVDNLYVNKYLEDITIGEFRLISSYDGTTKVAVLQSTFSGAWGAADQFQIRCGLPIVTGGTITAATPSAITLTAPASTVDAAYNGAFLFIPSLNEVRQIVDYVGATRDAIISPVISPAPAPGLPYEILPFTRDNEGRLYNITNQVHDSTCYSVELVSLVLPNVTLNSGFGGTISNYPYVYVELFANSTQRSGIFQNTLVTNNYEARNALFVASIVQISTNIRFITFQGDMKQVINFTPNGSLRFAVYLPNGELFSTADVDNVSPNPPNPTLQITAIFSFDRVNCRY